MILLLALWAALGATLYTIASTHPPMDALTRWAVIIGVLCVLGGLAIRSQPIGEATIFGRFGGAFVRWGFRATHGKLLPSVVISWLVWLVLGAAAIWAFHARNDLQTLIITLGWATQMLALFYVAGLWLSNAGANASFRMKFVSMAGVLLLMLAASVFLWFRSGEASRSLAVMIAAIPAGIAILYGVFVAAMMIVGRNARWN